MICSSVADLQRLIASPLDYVLYNYRWDEGPLADEDAGPDTWQAQVLRYLGQEIEARLSGRKAGAIRIAVRSGHGIGKGALTAWLVHFFLLCTPAARVVVTANTGLQLRSKTWAEVGKWHRLMRWHADALDYTATMMLRADNAVTHRADSVTWSITTPEAFQGTHEDFTLTVFDEASAIPQQIWDAVDGSLSGLCNVWLVLGNPTRATGPFRQVFRPDSGWQQYTVDARTAKRTNKAEIEALIARWGMDSDRVRVRVLGEFPVLGDSQFIGWDVIRAAQERPPSRDISSDNLALGLDVARGGGALSVLAARTPTELLWIKTWDVSDTMRLVGLVSDELNKHDYRALYVDSTGVGAGVFDRLVQLGWQRVIPVASGAKADDDRKYSNKRAEMWGRMKEWLETIGRIPDNEELVEQLGMQEHDYDRFNRIKLESKQSMAAKGLPSPDLADALALTFAYPLPHRKSQGLMGGAMRQTRAILDNEPLHVAEL